jgi:hypothetical protein
MANQRTGKYGVYYGSLWGESEYLTTKEIEANVRYIYSYLTAEGWTINAIAGLLGNLENESAINPGRWEGNDVGEGPGYGLVQWTPYTKYTEWCAEQGYADPSEMDTNLDRIIYELENGLQFYSTDSYPMTFKEFTKSTQPPYTLACAFAWNYERSAVVLWGTEEEKEALRQLRGGDANKWYKFLNGTDPEEPEPEPDVPGSYTPRKRMSFLLLLASGRRR